MVRAHLIYDGDCGFCTRTVGWLWRLGMPEWIEPMAAHAADALLREFGVDPAATTRAAFVLERGADADAAAEARRVHRGAAAINFCLRHNARSAFLRQLARLYHVPILRQLEDLGYWAIARSRRWLPGATDACRLPPAPPRRPPE